VPPDSVLADGRSGIAAHNSYCTDYHRASHELTWAVRGADFAQFVRCGYTGTAPYARIVWGGDPTEDDSEADGLAAAMNQGLSMGLSGIAYWGSDIGGFHSLFTADRTSPELLVRWLELGAFSGIMRTQAEGYERPDQAGLPRAEVWNPDVLPYWRALARLRTQLFPYTWRAAQEYQGTGLPIMRHLALAFPDEDIVWGRGDTVAVAAARDEFMFGDDLLVAPVVTMGELTRDVWLPPGEWVSFWDAVGYDDRSGAYVTRTPSSPPIVGGQVITVDAPLGRTPLFVRAGTCLPLLPPDVDTLDTRAGFAHDDDVVTLAEGIDRVRLLGFATACG
jgi:alpha-glucosidase (family GH31 glycosyl hydrolase)